MNITIISNDKRYEYLNEQLNELGYNSKLANINDKIETDILILSVRKEYTDVEYNSLFENSKIKTVLAPKYIENSIDYTDNEVFLKKNAYLTAEGAITLYYNKVKETLLNKKVLILGYGRIGKYLSKMLKSLNCDVSVYARRKEIQNEIVLEGYKSVAFQNVNYDVVFNTVPTTIINDEFKNCICIELANGFVNKENVINGNGIPGKMFPKTASTIILDAILPYLSIWEGHMIGYAFCGSFCTHKRSLEELKKLKSLGYDILPIMSENVYNTDTYFGKAQDLIKEAESITENKVIHTIVDAEPLGPKIHLDALIVAPCTGNTLAKIARGITDTSVTMATKAHLRSDRPTVIALCSNDALSANLQNISILLERKNVFFVPMKQDDVTKKPHSLVSEFSLLEETLKGALVSKQVRPLFI